ncbi:hypothetical protein B0H16DRAFT_1742276 [Mycena metata]|uniref:Uncharacterized protein n=1 Tax=Mycena metata TaxID=1033252 RepID=A0AAD7H987_9AGAR|nr:hypothetical protein B0H16DRAFT_1742276 [Mycena metata]
MSSVGKSRGVTPIVPTDELATTGELTTPRELTSTSEPSKVELKLTHAQKQAKEQAEEDLFLVNNYFSRIGRRQRIHEHAVHLHLKSPTKNSLRLVVETFDHLYDLETQVPPPLYPHNDTFDAKAAVARGRALAFSPDTAKAERVWAYGLPYTDGEAIERYLTNLGHHTDDQLPPTQGGRRDVLEAHHNTDPWTSTFDIEGAKEALQRIQTLARRLLPQHECQFGEGEKK